MATTHCLRRALLPQLTYKPSTLLRPTLTTITNTPHLQRTLLTTPPLRSRTPNLTDQFPTIPSDADTPHPPPTKHPRSSLSHPNHQSDPYRQPPPPHDDDDPFPDRLQRPKLAPLLPKRHLILSILALMGMTGIGITTYLISTTVPSPHSPPAHSSQQQQQQREYKYLPKKHQAEAPPSSTTTTTTTTPLPDGIPPRFTLTPHPNLPEWSGPLAPTVAGDYVLLGHGIRTVSFLRVKVYDVGMYIHVSDIPKLEAHLASTSTTISTNLTSPDLAIAEPALDAILATGVRTLFRIVPARNTDWAHLRDGWVRGIKARKSFSEVEEGEGEDGEEGGLVQAMTKFREMFTRTRGKTVEKGGTILLVREGGAGVGGRGGALQVWFDQSTAPAARARRKKVEEKGGEGGKEEEGMEFVGRVGDPRIARAIWGGYLAGKFVSSEELRGRVVDGLESGRWRVYV